MPTTEELRQDITVLAAAARRCAVAFEVKAGKAGVALKEKRRLLAQTRSAMAAAARPPFFERSALASVLWRAFTWPRQRKLRTTEADLERAARAAAQRAGQTEKAKRAMIALSDRLQAAVTAMDDLHHPPEQVSRIMQQLAPRIAEAVKQDRPNQISAVAKEALACIGAWAKASRLATERVKATEGDPKRVWLPIPESMGSVAAVMGAKEEVGVADAGRFYVNVTDPLSRFNALLPLAFRDVVPPLSFAAMPGGSDRENLSHFIDKTSWEHISNVNLSMTGRRCAMCGKTTGSLRRHLQPKREMPDGVECHEVWSWNLPDPSIKVGIQVLERLVVLCFDCHMCFHDEVAREMAHGIGGDDFERRVQGHLIKRRSFLTRTDPKTVAATMKTEIAAMKELASVDTWIVDLSALAKQDYMFGQTPTLISANRAGIKASHIAGIRFRTETGEIHPAVNPTRRFQEVAMRRSPMAEPGFKVIGK